MRHRTHWRTAALGVLSSLLLACGAPAAPAAQPAASKPAGGSAAAPAAAATAAPQPAAAQPERPPRTLQVGLIALAGLFYPIWVGARQGQFREQGVVPEINSVSTNESIQALLSGGLDILLASTDTAVTALSKGANLRMVGDHNRAAPYDLVSRPDVPGVQALRGQKVGVASLRGGSGSLARVMMRANGFGDDDYELTQAGGNPQRYVALQSGGIQAAILSDPVSFVARSDGYRILQPFSDVVPEYSFVSWWVRSDWLDSAENRDALQRFLAAVIQAREWTMQAANRERAIDIIQEDSRSPRPIAEQMYEYYAVTNPTVVDPTDLRDGPVNAVIQIMQELEDLPALPPRAQWFDRQYVERARQLAASR